MKVERGNGELVVRALGRVLRINWGNEVTTQDGALDLTWRVWGIGWLKFSRLTRVSRRQVDWWNDQRRFFREKQREVERHPERDPLRMTLAERHAATQQAVQKMKWSKTFVRAMTTPITLQMLERGQVRDPMTGAEFVLTPEEQVRLEGLTREDFLCLRRQYLEDKSARLGGGENAGA